MALGRFPNGFGRVPQRLWEGFPMGLGGVPNGFGECSQRVWETMLSSNRGLHGKQQKL